MDYAEFVKQVQRVPEASAARRRDNLIPLGQRIRQLRQQSNLSQEDLALRAGQGWTASTLSRIETGTRDMGVSSLWSLAAALGVPITALFDGL